MANPLKCDLCSKPATVHLTQIVNNKVHKVDLCEACAQEKGVTDPSGFSLADLLLKASLNPEPSGAGMRCEQCGFTQNDFKKHGRFGCPACYDAFKGLVEPMLDNMHKGVTHTGKVPARPRERNSFYDRPPVPACAASSAASPKTILKNTAASVARRATTPSR